MTHQDFETRLLNYIRTHGVTAEHLTFAQSCHSVAEAAQAAGVTPQDFIKSICFITKDERIVVAIVKGEDRVDRKAVQQLAGLGKLSIASADEMLRLTGYPAGGTPPFGFAALFLMDERVFEMAVVYGGGGSEHALIRATPSAVQLANGAQIAQIHVTEVRSN
jgi:prolyl-tRNA editing enzyme YbaK/EbsC (Cys-tRNA(Pro) deacylase)